jgi:hypothetical protein
MQLPNAPAQYDPSDQAQMRGALDRADKQNVKQGAVFDKILIRDTITGSIMTMTVASGAVIIT